MYLLVKLIIQPGEEIGISNVCMQFERNWVTNDLEYKVQMDRRPSF